MHEFSLCEGILKQVAKANHGKLDNVATVNLVVGKLAGVDLASLLFWFPVVAEKMHCAQIAIKVDEPDGIGMCNHCGQEFILHNLYDPCANCGTFGDYQIKSGRELLVKSFEL